MKTILLKRYFVANKRRFITAVVVLSMLGLSTGISSAGTGFVSLSASPNPIKVCDGSGQGKTTLSWQVPAQMVELRSSNGQLLTKTYGSGQFTTGKSVTNGTTFYLVTSGLSRTTLASVRVQITTDGCQTTTAPTTSPALPSSSTACSKNGISIVGASASRSLTGNEPIKAADNNLGTAWNSGAFPVQWWQADFGASYDLTGACLRINQLPNGRARHVISTGNDTSSLQTVAVVDEYLKSDTWKEVSFNTKSARYVRVKTMDSPAWVAWTEVKLFGNRAGTTDGGGSGDDGEIAQCPRDVRLTFSSTSLTVGGQSASISVPAGWSGGSFTSTNSSVARVDGNSLVPVAAGSTEVYGSGMWAANGAWPCSTDPVTVIVSKPQVEPFIGGYEIISNCFATSASISAVSNVPAEIQFSELRLEKVTEDSSMYTGPMSAALNKQADGSYGGSITVSTGDFPGGTAAIFRLYSTSGESIYPGYGAVSHDYDSQCFR